ncbi:uroporphyrinogen-III synthase [Peribacillus deserti]|uniref:Uroporphyrinogen-III synthase n=1 Tax=Peribacillus deserti TaxID=673318 RepID=A0ABS2QFN3_9BACI|nr:uroporphyrinogen-III synthase [Peribacillus deserti]MBM7691956.1 uroporphyrinogen-III synthase [Peribacillus deserti]
MTAEKPLQGVKILITRAESQAEPLIRSVETLGGTPISIPMINFKRVERKPLDGKFDWIIFTSVNALKYFHLTKDSLVQMGNPKLAAIGEKTKEAIESLGLSINFIPGSFVAEAFIEEFNCCLTAPSKILLPKGNLARDIIAESLRKEGHECTELIVYENIMPSSSERKLIDFLGTNKADILTFTSASTVVNFMKIVRENNLNTAIKNSIVACIGPAAKCRAESLGLTVDICPDTYTAPSMLQAIITFLNKNDESRRKL